MAEKVAKDIEKIMESVMTLEQTRGIPMKAAGAVGNTWGELK
jgi:DNA polymerase I-like protein with 3'-5' exonuclease and polymerase domains